MWFYHLVNLKLYILKLFKGLGLLNKVVKPHNGPSAILVLNAIGNHVVEDSTGFYGFGINGSLVSYWL